MTTESAGSPTVERGWATVAFWAAIVLIASFLFIQAVIAKIVIPPLAVFIVLFAVAAFFTRRKPRAGTIAVGVLGVLAIAGNLPPIIEDLGHPESTATFVVTAFAVLAAFAGVVAAVGAITRSSGGAARTVGLVFVGLGVLALIGGVVAGLGVENDAVASGDVEVVARDVKFEPRRIETEAGAVSVHVDNKDLTRHTFTVEDLDVSEELPGGKGTRIEIADAAPGTYDVTCEVFGHEDMTAVLVVE